MSMLLVACSSKSSPYQISVSHELHKEAKSYVKDGKRVGIGCSKIHFKGVEAQRSLALQRAIEQIGLQKQSTIQTTRQVRSSYSKGQLGSSKTATTSTQSSNTKVSAQVISEKATLSGDNLCVLVVED